MEKLKEFLDWRKVDFIEIIPKGESAVFNMGGGSYTDDKDTCRITLRYSEFPDQWQWVLGDNRESYNGFRIVRTLG